MRVCGLLFPFLAGSLRRLSSQVNPFFFGVEKMKSSDLVEVKTSNLTGAALDWATAMASEAWKFAHTHYPTMTLDPTFSGVEARMYPRGEFGTCLPTCVLVPNNPMRQDPQPYCPSIDWEQCGKIIDANKISVNYDFEDGEWIATDLHLAEWIEGDTPLIAACRAIVASKLGDTVQIPAELLS